MANTNPARGTRDFLPSDVRKREYVIGIIKEVYESYGFEPLETPSFENIETLTGKYGEEGNQLIYKILKRGEKLEAGAAEKDLSDLALRYDLTVPLARVVANNRNELPKFFKRYQIQPVWRADRPAKGRYREFYQCDVDAIGSDSMVVEAELISAVSEILERLGFNDFVIRINERILLTELLEAAGVPAAKHSDALTALDKLDKIGREGVAKEFSARGVNPDAGERLLIFFESLVESDLKGILGKPSTKKLISLQKRLAEKESIVDNQKRAVGEIQKTIHESVNQILDKIKKKSPERLDKISKSTDVIVKGIDHINELFQGLGNLVTLHSLGKFLFENKLDKTEGVSNLLNLLKSIEGLPASNRVSIDPTLARGLSYYTGTIMEVNVPDLAGSLAGGGRYDGLIGMFGKEQIPACGVSLGLERILVVMEERGMFPPELQDSSADVMVTIWNEDSIAESLKLAGELRAQKLRVLVYPEADKLGKQFKYAGQINVPYVCVVGETELAENKVTVKNMTTGAQEIVSRETVGEYIQR